MGNDLEGWSTARGDKLKMKEWNGNGVELLSFCQQHSLMIANSFFDSPVQFTFKRPDKLDEGFDHVLVLYKHIHKVYDCATSLEFTSSDHLLVLMELNQDVGVPPVSRDRFTKTTSEEGL